MPVAQRHPVVGWPRGLLWRSGMLASLAGGFVAGVCTQLCWRVLPSASGLLVCAILLLFLSRLPACAGWRQLARVAAGVALGAWWALLVAQDVLAARLPETAAETDFTIAGELRAQRLHGDGSATWTIAVGQLPWHSGRGHWTLRIVAPPTLPLAVGERWRLRVHLKPPHAAQNPGAPDFEQYLFGERVVATGSLRDSNENRRLRPALGLAHWRQRMLAAASPFIGAGAGDLATDDSERFARAVLPALVLDERSALTAPQWRLLADTGTAHLVAISGLHVALLWGAVLWAFSLAGRRHAGSLRFRPLPVLAALLAATLYAALAGMPLPAARAVLMLAAATALLLRDGGMSPWRVWLLATALVLVVDPLAVHGAAFWLSHGAVALLLLLGGLQRRAGGTAIAAWRVAVGVQWRLSLAMMPLLCALFGSASLSSALANLPAIPLVNLLALPAALCGFLLAPFAPSLADPCIDAAIAVLGFLWRLLQWIDAWPLLSPLPLPGGTAVGNVALLGVAMLLLLVRENGLRGALLLLAVLAWPVATPLPSGQAQVCVLDVGQGLAATVRTQHRALLYDSGPAWSADSDAGRNVVVPALRAAGVRQLDLLLLSHHDLDHIGGAPSVTAALRPRGIVTGDPRSRRDGQGEVCTHPRRWHWDGIEFLLLPGTDGEGDNNRSCVLRVAAGAHALLLPGDIDRRRELELAAQFPQPAALAADVLVAAHHGSRTSGSATFLQRVGPQAVVFSAGYRNRFGHPHPVTLAAVRRQAATPYLTARDGAVCIDLRADGNPRIVTARAARRRFWQAAD